MSTITFDVAVEMLREIVKTKPDGYVYDNSSGPNAGICLYVEESPEGPRPSCIVGHFLHGLGVPLSELEAEEFRVASTVLQLGGPIRRMVDITGMAVDLLAHAQFLQDRGDTWSKSVEGAVSYTQANWSPFESAQEADCS